MEDLKRKDVVDMLSVIIMIEMNKPPLTSFKSLTAGQQKKFNLACNKYIKETLYVADDWEEKLKSDFNLGCNDELYVGSFKAEAQFCPILNTDIIRLRREGEEDMD
jgi:hypothetical protein